MRNRNATSFLTISGAILAALAAGCGPNRPAEPAAVTPAPAPSVFTTDFVHPEAVGGPLAGRPWIAHVNLVDLDRDGRMDIVACDAQKNQVLWLRQMPDGKFEEHVLADDIAAPVHVEAVDIDGDGDLDLLVASMGMVHPNNDLIGSVIILENDGHQHFTKHVIIDHVARVTDVRAADFNHDGKLDLAVAQFGYDQGEIRWMENLGNWQFKSHNLLNLSGTINVLSLIHI